MAVPIVLLLGALSLASAVLLTLYGLLQIASSRGRNTASTAAPATAPVSNEAAPPAQHWVYLDDLPALQAEPGVLLNTLWEHVTAAECQQGECGGCRLRLLDGEVRWIREPQVEIDKRTHILACSCEPMGNLRCARP